MTDPRELLDQYRNGFAKRARAALRAVLDIHNGGHECPAEDGATGWYERGDCPTVQAITKALGGKQ